MVLKNNKNTKGFTIVELLIVIVVIGILAAITIVAYNGIQQRAKGTKAETAAKQVLDKAVVHHALKNVYPADQTAFNAVTESKLSGVTINNTAGAVSASTGENTVSYTVGTNCVTVGFWDYAAATPAVNTTKFTNC